MSMRIEGTLAKWNNERGFGFISPDQGGPDVFVHASAFPQDGVRPVPGARLSFEIDVDQGGRKRAVSVLRLKRAVTRVETRAVPRKRKSRHGRLQWWVLVAIVAGLAYYAYGSYVRFQVQHTVVAEPVVSTPPPPPDVPLAGPARYVAAALAQSSAHNQRLGLSAVQQRLEALIAEADRSSDRYAARFRPVAALWRKLVAEHAQALGAAVELRQELDNPYVIGVPLTLAQELFVGRTDVSARIEQLLLDRRRPPLLLYGQRRMGKTSLLNNLGRLLPTGIVPLFVDLQGPASAASDHTGLLYNLARSMIDSARRQRGVTLPPLGREALAQDPFTAFDEWLDRIEAALGERTALLTLDEFEALAAALRTGRFEEAAVLGMLRHVVQHRPRIKVLLASSHTLDELSLWSSYFVNVQVVQVGYLDDEDARRLIEQPVPGFALRYEPAASRRLLELTRELEQRLFVAEAPREHGADRQPSAAPVQRHVHGRLAREVLHGAERGEREDLLRRLLDDARQAQRALDAARGDEALERALEAVLHHGADGHGRLCERGREHHVVVRVQLLQSAALGVQVGEREREVPGSEDAPEQGGQLRAHLEVVAAGLAGDRWGIGDGEGVALDRVWAVAEVPEAQALRLTRGQKVTAALQADPSQTFNGTVRGWLRRDGTIFADTLSTLNSSGFTTTSARAFFGFISSAGFGPPP